MFREVAHVVVLDLKLHTYIDRVDEMYTYQHTLHKALPKKKKHQDIEHSNKARPVEIHYGRSQRLT